MMITEPQTTAIDPLVHLAIDMHVDQQNRVQSVLVHERPFLGDLQLDSDPDDPALLIAIGEMMGLRQPLSASRISFLNHFAILWLDTAHWLIIQAPGELNALPQLLKQTFGADMTLSETAEGLTVQLNQAALDYLEHSANTRSFQHENNMQRLLKAQQPIQVMCAGQQSNYEVLVRKGCAQALWQWLKPH